MNFVINLHLMLLISMKTSKCGCRIVKLADLNKTSLFFTFNT
jgi:hypothetical protein